MNFTEIVLNGIDENGTENKFKLSDFKGKNIILYFYPKDNTPGCIKEACNFRDNMNRLTPYATVIGISSDNTGSHKKFQQDKHLNFILLSDTDKELAKALNIPTEKFGFERTTFVINIDGEIVKEWRNVNPTEHINTVLDYILNNNKEVIEDIEAQEDF